MKQLARPDGPPAFFSPQILEARRFYLDLAPPATKPLAVVSGGREHCAPDYSIHRHTFPYLSVEFVTRGKGALRLNGREHGLSAGVVFAYGPNVAQDITTEPAEPLVKYFVDFTGPLATKLLRQCRLSPGSVARVLTPGEIQNIFDDLIHVALRGSRFSTRICELLLEQLILRIAECQMPQMAVETPAFATYQRCRQHIQSQYLRLRTQAQVARECHVTSAYLCRLFQRYDHQTPYQYLMRLKMSLAAERLQAPGTLIKQVAAELGFGDPFHFSRAFKAAFGLAPEAFRRLR
jgi:AraC-like DNA-binding protein/quercetin dioxygenase-like cupin family protein